MGKRFEISRDTGSRQTGKCFDASRDSGLKFPKADNRIRGARGFTKQLLEASGQ